MTHNFLTISQNDPRWKNIILGESNVTIGQDGCYMVSFCCVADYFGKIIYPMEMNSEFIKRKLYVQGDYIGGDDTLQKLYPDIVYQKSYQYPDPTPADLQMLKALLAEPNLAVIVEIEIEKGNFHYTPVVECDGVNVTIMNVWNGQVEDIRKNYGDPATKIVKFIVYQGTPGRPQVPVDSDVFERLVTKATTYDNILTYIGFPADRIAAGNVSFEEVKIIIDALKNKPPQIITKEVELPAKIITVQAPIKADLPKTDTISTPIPSVPKTVTFTNTPLQQDNIVTERVFLDRVIDFLRQFWHSGNI